MTNTKIRRRIIDIVAAISGQSPAIALAIVCLFFLNKNNLDSLRERREWLQTLERITDRYDARMAAVIQVTVEVKGEMHALRNKMTEKFLKDDAAFLRLGAVQTAASKGQQNE